MFWTAFVWGIGVSFGASIGFMSLLVMWHFFDRAVNKVRESEYYKALTERNEISEKMLGQLVLIAAALEKRDQ